MIVEHSPDCISSMVRKALLSAIPVTIPGSAIGSTTRRLTVDFPKKLKRCSANDSAVPEQQGDHRRRRGDDEEVEMADSAPALANALPHHSVVKPGGGHAKVLLVENELSTTTRMGT